MAKEYDDYGKRKRNTGLDGSQGSDYLDGVNSAHNDYELPDYTGLSNQTGVNVPKAGRANPFSNRLGTGMQAVADTKEAMSDPDNSASTRTFQAGQHDAVSSSIQNEHNPDNASSTRAFQGMNHDVAKNTIEGQYDLEKQPTSSLFRAMRGNGKRVPGLEAVEQTDRAVDNLDYDNASAQSHPYVNGIHQGFANSFMNFMKQESRGTEFDRASWRPDLYTGKTPFQTGFEGAKEQDRLNDARNLEYEKTRYHFREPTAEAIHRASEKYGNVLGGVAGVSLLSAVKGVAPIGEMSLSLNNWSRLSSDIYQRVYEKTGNEEFATALGYGAIGMLASDLQPAGLFSKRMPLDYQTVLDPVSRVIDSIVSDSISNKFVDMAVDDITNKKSINNKIP